MESVPPHAMVNAPYLDILMGMTKPLPKPHLSSSDHGTRWRPIVGYEASYEVSADGRVRRIASAFGTRAGHILKPGTTNVGYPVVSLWKDNRGRSFTVHSLMAAAFIGPRPDGFNVNHKNGIKTDNRLDNLEYITGASNTMHRYRVLKKHGQPTKLTTAQVAEIRRAPTRGGALAALSRKFGVSSGLVSRIKHGKCRVSRDGECA